MNENEKLIEAAEKIKKYCEKTILGEPCIFSNGYCGITKCCFSDGNIPQNWNIGSRWTDSDIMMAKALKKIGYYTIQKNQGNKFPYAKKANGYSLMLDLSLFKDLRDFEIVDISDIISNGDNRCKL